jgi:GTPase SAR1 family protein
MKKKVCEDGIALNVMLTPSRFYSWELPALERPRCGPSSCKRQTTLSPLTRVDTILKHIVSVSSNNPASLTSRLGVTTDVEQNHVRFLGDLILNLWDCGGQDSYMQQYLSTQQATIFASVGVLIYVFEIKSRDAVSDAEYFRRILDALKRYSPGADVFILVHKMDLVGQGRDRQLAFENKKKELLKEAGAVAPGLNIQIFGTSIYDESLYRVSIHTSSAPSTF